MTKKSPPPDEPSGFEAIVRAAKKLHPDPKPDEATAKALAESKENQTLYVGQELKFRAIRNDHAQLDLTHQRWYGCSIAVLLPVWLLAIFVLVLAQAFSFHGIKISDQVLIALIGSTTLNVIGLYAIVAKYLFSRKKPK